MIVIVRVYNVINRVKMQYQRGNKNQYLLNRFFLLLNGGKNKTPKFRGL